MTNLRHFSNNVIWKMNYWWKRELNYYKINPVDALFFLTYRCTSRCKTCTMWKKNDEKQEMNLEGWKVAVKMCYEIGVRWIELFGGDALLRKDILVDLVRYIKSYEGLACDLATNCNLMDQEMAEGLVKAGIDDIWISMDGVGIDHDSVRGRSGTFERVERAIGWLQQARGTNSRPRLNANCTISKHNVNYFDKLLSYAERMNLDSLHLEYVGEFWQETLDKSDIEGIKPTPYYVRDGNETSLVNTGEAYSLKNKIEKMKLQSQSMKVKLFTENIDKLSLNNIVKGKFDNNRCYIIRGKVSIDPSGYILGCPFYPGWKMGNIREQHLENIWRNDRHKKFIRAFKQGNFYFCDYCILGVQRNNTLFQDIRYEINKLLGRVRF